MVGKEVRDPHLALPCTGETESVLSTAGQPDDGSRAHQCFLPNALSFHITFTFCFKIFMLSKKKRKSPKLHPLALCHLLFPFLFSLAAR